MPDSTFTPSAWRSHARSGTPTMVGPRFDDGGSSRRGQSWLSFRDFAAIQIAAALKSGGRELSPRETAEVAFDLAAALEEERARRDQRVTERSAAG